MKNKDFFTRIKNYFKASYGGSYFSIILKEILIEEPQLAKFLFKGQKNPYDPLTTEIVVEWDFPSDLHGGYYLEYENSVWEREEEICRNLGILKS